MDGINERVIGALFVYGKIIEKINLAQWLEAIWLTAQFKPGWLETKYLLIQNTPKLLIMVFSYLRKN